MSIVVTAASGQLGRLTVEKLLERGTDPATVVAGARDTAKVADLAERGVRTVTLDYDDPAGLAQVLAEGDTVLLVSGSEVGKRVPQHTNVIEAAKAAGVARLVYTSAPHADTSELLVNPEHKATEEALQASGLTTTVLRNNWYTENYAPTLAQVRATGTLLTSAHDGRVASTSRADYAEAAAIVLTTDGHEGRTYELGGDHAWDLAELASTLGEVLGREVTLQDVSTEEHAAALRAAGLDEGTIGFVTTLDANIAAGDLAETTGELAKLLGRPTTPLVEGLRALA